MNLKRTMRECLDDKPGKIYADWMDGEFRCIILRGPVSICGYIGVNKDNPLFQKGYDDLTIRCHGGLTFADMGGDGFRPEGFWYFGWDYAHYGDVAFYDLASGYFGDEERDWSPQDVMFEFPEVISQFVSQTKLHLAQPPKETK